MTQKDNGGPAFPTEPRAFLSGAQYEGITLRDYFAGQALVGLFAGSDPDRAEQRFGQRQRIAWPTPCLRSAANDR